MLKGINPRLGPELLAVLRGMGHGDEIAIVDGNYPAVEHARRLVRADGHGIAEMIDAILSVLPVDDFVEQAIFRSTVGTDQDVLHPVHEQMLSAIELHLPGHKVTPLVGSEFYDRVKAAHVIVATGEHQLYANLIIRKGVIYPD